MDLSSQFTINRRFCTLMCPQPLFEFEQSFLDLAFNGRDTQVKDTDATVLAVFVDQFHQPYHWAVLFVSGIGSWQVIVLVAGPWLTGDDY